MSKLVKLSGTLHWVFCNQPRLGYKAVQSEPDKYEWTATVHMTKESLMEFMDLQANYGLKNKLSKTDEGGYSVSFKRPTERVNKKTGKVIKKYEKPEVTVNGAPFDGIVGSGSEGNLILELEEFLLQGNRKGYAARLHSVEVTKLVPHGTEQGQQKGFDQ